MTWMTWMNGMKGMKGMNGMKGEPPVVRPRTAKPARMQTTHGLWPFREYPCRHFCGEAGPDAARQTPTTHRRPSPQHRISYDVADGSPEPMGGRVVCATVVTSLRLCC